MTINEKLATIQTKFKSKKSRFNSFGKYNFRSAEDILEATKPFLLELGVAVTISEQLVESNAFPIICSTATISDGENAIHATALVGVDLDQKGMQMPQKFGSASSYGKKYALGNLFLIDDTEDSDATNSHGSDAATKQKPTLTSTKDPAYPKAVQYVKAGGKVEVIKAKYALSQEIEKALKLREDENYYGKLGKQYLSNSDIGTLLTNPLALGTSMEPSAAFLVGGYFHTAILEPDKLKKYKIVESSTRNTKAYKEISGGELCLLQKEVDQIDLMKDKMLENDICRGLIRGTNVDYEQPGITELEGLQ
jgi:hypothetical protein